MRQMKDSGIEWIGRIPTEWDIKVAFQLFKQVKNKNEGLVEQNLLSLSYGKIKRKSIDTVGGLLPESFDGYNIIEQDDIVLRLTDLQNDQTSLRVGLSNERGIVTSAYLALRNQSENTPLYLYYYLHAFDICKGFYGMGAGVRQGLNWDGLKLLKFVLPPIDEQSRITSYLDKRCAEIDVIIAKTKETLEEYKRLKQSAITEAVTKGIHKAGQMKDSGIEWIGEIPAQWDIRKGKWILSRLERPVKDDDGVITCFRDGEVTLRAKRREDGFTFSVQEAGYQGIEPGDLVVHGMDGFAGAIGISDSRGKGTPVLNVLGSNQDKRYIMYYLRNMAYNGIFLALSTGIRVRSCDTNWNKLKELPYLVPVAEEQREIADYLDMKCAEMDAIIAKKMALIEELETYKKALIYEYVTGKKEVGTAEQAVTTIVYPYFPAVLGTNKTRFAQAVLMSRILDKCRTKMGRVKLEKMLYTIETSIGFDFDTDYVRQAAGPLDESIYDCEAIISRRNKWYTMKASKYGVSYTPAKDNGKYKQYYDKYFADYDSEIERIIGIFMDYDADQAEIVATLFAAWNDFVIDRKEFTDEQLVDEVLNNWNDSKKRFSKDVWLRAIEQMRQNNIVPKGYGKRTVIKN